MFSFENLFTIMSGCFFAMLLFFIIANPLNQVQNLTITGQSKIDSLQSQLDSAKKDYQSCVDGTIDNINKIIIFLGGIGIGILILIIWAYGWNYITSHKIVKVGKKEAGK